MAIRTPESETVPRMPCLTFSSIAVAVGAGRAATAALGAPAGALDALPAGALRVGAAVGLLPAPGAGAHPPTSSAARPAMQYGHAPRRGNRAHPLTGQARARAGPRTRRPGSRGGAPAPGRTLPSFPARTCGQTRS